VRFVPAAAAAGPAVGAVMLAEVAERFGEADAARRAWLDAMTHRERCRYCHRKLNAANARGACGSLHCQARMRADARRKPWS
jgi:hypothetical protein